ncbi:hypothetical protein JNJ66_06005 [Candidatus Saccharibacteria bacterium]|nr:hypothetical protein [Candidatus Saccharibacteria bacterium]
MAINPDTLYDHDRLEHFALATAAVQMSIGALRRNSFATYVWHNDEAHCDPTSYLPVQRITFDLLENGLLVGEHDAGWYLTNAEGKARICATTQRDSLEVAHLDPALIVGISGAYPHGGGVIDRQSGIIVATSGFEEDEDVQFSRLVLDRINLERNRTGRLVRDFVVRRSDDPQTAAQRLMRGPDLEEVLAALEEERAAAAA